MFNSFKESIGLEIGDGLVKAMLIKSNARENKLIGFSVSEVNFRDGRQGIVKAIQQVLADLEVNKKKHKVNISVSGESVMVRDIHWPQMSEDEIRKALKFEVERQVHYKTEEIIFDYYSILDKSIVETKTRVILVAAKKNLIENYQSLIESSGYQCGFIEVDTFSLLNCFYLNGPKIPLGKTVAVISVGMEVTNIDIVKGKIVGLTKDAFVAWSNLLDALPKETELDFLNITELKGLMGSDDIYELALFIVNALSNQIRRTIEFYESQGRDTVDEIYLSGRLTMCKNLDKYLKEVLGLKVNEWNPLANLQINAKTVNKQKVLDNAKMLAICVGLACYRFFDINLSTKRIERKSTSGNKILSDNKGIIMALIITVFFLIGIWVVLIGQIKIKEANKEKLLNEKKELEVVLKSIDNLRKGRELLGRHMLVAKTLFSRRLVWSEKLYQISKNLPSDIWLTEIFISKTTSRKDSASNSFDEINFLFKDEKPPAIISTQEVESLFIKGIAYSEFSDKMLLNINVFINNLKEDKDFLNSCEKIELNRLYRQKLGETPVIKFEIECQLK